MNKMDNEIWRDVVGFEGIFIVSNYGNVKSLPRISSRGKWGKYTVKGKTLKHVYRNSYPSVFLLDKYYNVHRLVAQAFIPNPNGYKEVNHKDENPANCRLDNLEWCDHKYNINYGTRTERASKKHREFMRGRPSKTKKKVFFNGKTYDSLCDFCKSFDKNLSTVSRWLNNKRPMPEEFRNGGLSYLSDVEVTI